MLRGASNSLRGGHEARPSPTSPRPDSIELDDPFNPSPADVSSEPPNLLEQADERGVAPSPMERYWVEPQRHERIAVMMTGKGPDPAPSIVPSSSSTWTASSRAQDAKRKPSTSSIPNDLNRATRSPSPGFCPGLVIDVDADAMEDEPGLEAIKIAARIK